MEEYMISIIVPVYNAEMHLNKCVDSILAQTYTNIEVILVDDGSSDGSERICDEYQMKDSRVLVFHKENGGVSSARNLALKKARGDYVMFVDADDWIEENMCRTMMDEALIHKVMLVITQGINRDEDGKIEDTRELSERGNSRVIDTEREFSFLDEYAPGVVWGNLYRRDCISNLWFDEDISLGEDTLFFARAVKQCPQILILTERFYNYVKYSESAAHGAMNEKKMTNLLAWNRIEKIYEDNSRILRTVRGAYGRQCAFFLRRMCSSGDRTEPYYGICREGVRNNFWDMMADKSVKHRIFYLGMLLAPKLYCRLKG